MRAAAALAVTAALVGAPALPAAADSSRMSLVCEGIDLTIERSNGASWWGSDNAVYTTKYLRVVSEHGTYEKSYGHTARPHVVCAADHVTPEGASRWTVQLVLAG